MGKNIPVQVEKRMAWTGWPGYIVCGNTGYTITFTFDKEWEGVTAKTARFKFRTDEGMGHTDQPFTGNTVEVPVLSNIREVQVGVFAGDLTTTTGASIRCTPSILCGSGEATEYEKQRFDELMQLFNDLLHGHDNQELLDRITEEMLNRKGLTDEEAADLNANTAARHTHRNPKTLNGFYCESLETGFETDVSSTALKWQGREIAFASGSTATISNVEEIEKDGQKYLRISLSQADVVYNKLPDYIDIPIASSKDVSENPTPDITLNGSELEFEVPDTSKYVPKQKTEAVAGDTNILQPNVFYSFGEVAALNISFADGEADRLNEYSFAFASGETATVLTLPSTVKWVNELTVESNKRYEISVVDNVALWCAVEVTE